jgi:endonuclease/exonuclease/phosphatase family metal-dependent hydrolase
MGGFAYQKKQVEAWPYLENTLKPDIALLQEVPCSIFDKWRECRQGFAYQGAAFGTMIFCAQDFAGKTIANDDHSFRQSDIYVSAVDVRLKAKPIAIMSVHVYPGKQQKKTLTKLLGFLEQALCLKPTIVGGDFNACRHYDVIYKKNSYSWFFEEMERIGFYDCHFGLHGKEKQTYWSKKTAEPYQDDHIFVPADWKNRIIRCDVLPYDPTRGMSDHGPIELVIDLSHI